MPPPQDRHLDIPARVSRGGSTRVILEIVGVAQKRHADLTDDMHKHQNQPGSGGRLGPGATNEFGWQVAKRKAWSCTSLPAGSH